MSGLRLTNGRTATDFCAPRTALVAAPGAWERFAALALSERLEVLSENNARPARVRKPTATTATTATTAAMDQAKGDLRGARAFSGLIPGGAAGAGIGAGAERLSCFAARAR